MANAGFRPYLSEICPEGIAITNRANPYTPMDTPIAAPETPNVSAYKGNDGTIAPKPS